MRVHRLAGQPAQALQGWSRLEQEEWVEVRRTCSRVPKVFQGPVLGLALQREAAPLPCALALLGQHLHSHAVKCLVLQRGFSVWRHSRQYTPLAGKPGRRR